MLGDYGADVIKIERIGAGDLSRWSIGDDPAGPLNPVFSSLNRNKRSIALDLKSKAGIEVVHRLLASADVIANNFRAGVMDRMGLGYDALRARYPRLIYAEGTGYGTQGPYAHKGGQDILAQALSGVMARKCDPARSADDLPDVARRLLRRNASRAGRPARAAAPGAHRRGADGVGVALRFDAGDADAGGGDVADAGAARLLLGRAAA